MITAVDTNVLLDIFLPDPDFGLVSKEALAAQFSKGSLVICDVVYAELATVFESKEALDGALMKLGVRFMAVDQLSAYEAGAAWRRYRRRSQKKSRVLADFLIGAHAQKQANVLLTRDRGFYRDYFPHLKIVSPVS